ncbi:hypothetical protein HNW13_017955 [Shewanella sp. BF02_Schw]|uniref:hypothetical protein n=1 Tax=Shewanella sp. BF02_Schw TaxID=394908 RepID=UPI001783F527|nr:hypothetical protein [Shewanella sp. BF02_Schw]MBO1897624.1 hypothetical protein [Shewanella sp. BF02_Schw]
MSLIHKVANIFFLMVITISAAQATSEGRLEPLSLKSISGIYTAEVYELDPARVSKWSKAVGDFESALNAIKKESNSEIQLSKAIVLMKGKNFSKIIVDAKDFNEDRVKAKLKEHYQRQLSAAEVNRFAAKKRLAEYLPTYTRIAEGYRRSVQERADLSDKAAGLTADFDAAKRKAINSLNEIGYKSDAKNALATIIGDNRFYKTKSYPEKRFGKVKSCYASAKANPSDTDVIYSEPVYIGGKSYCASLDLRAQTIKKQVDKLGPNQIANIQMALNKYIINRKLGGKLKRNRDGYFNDHPELINIARRFKSAEVDKKRFEKALLSFDKEVAQVMQPSESELSGLLASLLIKLVDDTVENYKLSILTSNLVHVSTMANDGKFELSDDYPFNLMVLEGRGVAGVKPFVKIIPTTDSSSSSVKLLMSDLLTLDQLQHFNTESNKL